MPHNRHTDKLIIETLQETEQIKQKKIEVIEKSNNKESRQTSNINKLSRQIDVNNKNYQENEDCMFDT